MDALIILENVRYRTSPWFYDLFRRQIEKAYRDVDLVALHIYRDNIAQYIDRQDEIGLCNFIMNMFESPFYSSYPVYSSHRNDHIRSIKEKLHRHIVPSRESFALHTTKD
jgi:hypothetical protein